jgi:hypothetical protein
MPSEISLAKERAITACFAFPEDMAPTNMFSPVPRQNIWLYVLVHTCTYRLGGISRHVNSLVGHLRLWQKVLAPDHLRLQVLQALKHDELGADADARGDHLELVNTGYPGAACINQRGPSPDQEFYNF